MGHHGSLLNCEGGETPPDSEEGKGRKLEEEFMEWIVSEVMLEETEQFRNKLERGWKPSNLDPGRLVACKTHPWMTASEAGCW